MTHASLERDFRRLTTPRAASVAGMMALIFPGWVMLISLFILWIQYKQPDQQLGIAQ